MVSMQNPPPDLGTPPPGLRDLSLPGDQNPVAGSGQQMLTQMWTEFTKACQGATETPGLVTLQQVTDTILAKGYVTQADLSSFEAAVAAASPSLPAPAQALLDAFGFELKSIDQPPGAECNIPIGQVAKGSKGNPFLNCSATLELFKLTSAIISIMSKIQLKENLKSVEMSKVQLGMAVMAAQATKLAGDIESQKDLAQEIQYSIAASFDIAQVAITCISSMYQSYLTSAETQKYLAGKTLEKQTRPEINDKELTATEKASVDKTVQDKMSMWTTASGAVISAGKDLNQATMQGTLSTLAIQEATQNALKELLNKLVDLVGQAASMLSQSADKDAGGVITAQLQLFKTWIEAAAQMWRTA